MDTDEIDDAAFKLQMNVTGTGRVYIYGYSYVVTFWFLRWCELPEHKSKGISDYCVLKSEVPFL